MRKIQCFLSLKKMVHIVTTTVNSFLSYPVINVRSNLASEHKCSQLPHFVFKFL
jgi:hypothetical protein